MAPLFFSVYFLEYTSDIEDSSMVSQFYENTALNFFSLFIHISNIVQYGFLLCRGVSVNSDCDR